MELNKTILILVTQSQYFSSHRFDLGKSLALQSYKVYLATEVNSDTSSIEALGITIIPLKYLKRSSISIVAEYNAIKELNNLIRNLKPDIVHFFAMKPVVYGTLVAKCAGIKTIINTLPGLGFIYSSEALLAKLLKLPLRLALACLMRQRNVILTLQNKTDLNEMLRLNIPQKNLKLIRGSGVNTTNLQPLAQPSEQLPLQIVYAGRLLKDKGIIELSKVIKICQHLKLPVIFHIYGSRDPKNPSSISVKEYSCLKSQMNVKYHGYEQNIHSVWKNAHIGILPSYREGMPKALLEAQAYSRAVIAADTPGCSDLVIHNFNGWLVPKGDVIGMVNAIQDALNCPEKMLKYANNGYQRVVKYFSSSVVNDQYLSLYE